MWVLITWAIELIVISEDAFSIVVFKLKSVEVVFIFRVSFTGPFFFVGIVSSTTVAFFFFKLRKRTFFARCDSSAPANLRSLLPGEFANTNSASSKLKRARNADFPTIGDTGRATIFPFTDLDGLSEIRRGVGLLDEFPSCGLSASRILSSKLFVMAFFATPEEAPAPIRAGQWVEWTKLLQAS